MCNGLVVHCPLTENMKGLSLLAEWHKLSPCCLEHIYTVNHQHLVPTSQQALLDTQFITSHSNRRSKLSTHTSLATNPFLHKTPP